MTSEGDKGPVDEPRADEGADASDRDSKDDDAMRALLKRAAEVPEEKPAPELLGGVQKKLRVRSKGKFYADGWSTGHARYSYAMVALVMLVVIGIAYVALGPVGFSAR